MNYIHVFTFMTEVQCSFISCFSGVPATTIRKARLVLIRLRRLELIAIYVIEASFPTIILFCVIREDVGDVCKWQTFWPSSLHLRQISHADPHAKSGTDEGYWAETSAIYINHQHLRRLHKRELSWESWPRSHKLLKCNVSRCQTKRKDHTCQFSSGTAEHMSILLSCVV